MRAARFFTSLFILNVCSPLAFAGTFNDLNENHESYLAIEYLAAIETLEGYEDGSFQPDRIVNRAEIVKMLVTGQGIFPDPEIYNNCFPDVQNEWYAPFICYAHEQEWVQGYPDLTFKPAQTVNKVEALKILIYALSLESFLPVEVNELPFDDVYSNEWYGPYIYLGTSWNLLEVSSGSYNPSGDMTRARVAEYLFRTLVIQELSLDSYSSEFNQEFLSTHGLDSLLFEGSVLLSIAYVNYDGQIPQVESDEYIQITNAGTQAVSLLGYSLSGSNGDETFIFPAIELLPGENVFVYTNQGEYNFGSDKALWNNSGETVYLWNSSGEMIDEYSY